MTPASVRRTIVVAVDPHTAFTVFTERIGDWYVGGRHAWHDPERAVGIRMEPGVGGRWIEVWDADTGEGYTLGTVLEWEPGDRLVLSYRHPWLPPEPLTEIEVRFTATTATTATTAGTDGTAGTTGTRVTLEHRGFDLLPPDVADRFVSPNIWTNLLRWYTDHLAAETVDGA